MKTSLAIRLVLSMAFAGVAVAAHAQYIWLDEHGVKQFSDQPPPSNIPQKNVLKEPGKATKYVSQSESDDGSVDQDSEKTDNAPKSIEDQNADFNKRRIAQAEKEKKAAEQAKRDADKAKNCQRARAYQNALASGRRIATADENGERVFMSDEDRAQDMNENRRILQNCP